MIRRFAVCVLVGAVGLGVAPRPAAAAPERVVTGSHYHCMYHCDERAHRFEGTAPKQKSRPRSLAQTTTQPKPTFCQRAAPDPTNQTTTFADRLLSWLYAAFCTSPTAQPAAAPGQPAAQLPVVKPPVVQPPIVKPPVAQPPIVKPPIVQPPVVKPPVVQPPVVKPPLSTGKPGPWWPFPSSSWPNSHGSSGWGDHSGGWGHHDSGWGHDGGEKRSHDDGYRWECRTKRHHDDYKWECRKKRDHDDGDRGERRKKRDWDGWR